MTKRHARWDAYAAIGLELPANDVVCAGLNDADTVQRAISERASSLSSGDLRRATCVLLSGFRVRSMYIRWMHDGVSWYVARSGACVCTTRVRSVDRFIHNARQILFGRLYRYVGLDTPPASAKVANEHLSSVHAKAYTSVLTDAERKVFDTQVVPMITNPRARSAYDKLLSEGDSAVVRVRLNHGRCAAQIIPTDTMRFEAIEDGDPCIEKVVPAY